MFRTRIAFLLLALSTLCLHADEPFALKLAKTIPLPGVKGRFDHFALDVKRARLFVAALGNNSLEAIDLTAAKRIQSIPGLGKPTGVLFLPNLNRLFVACGDDRSVRVFHGDSLRLLKTIPGLADADNVRFDRKADLIYLGFGDGALASIRASTADKIAEIKLSGHPESFQLEETGGWIFVNVPDAKHVAVIDREKRAVVAAWPMKEFQANFPMALDEPDRRLFIGCRNPARLVVLDMASGKKVADLAISGDIDDLFYDAARRRFYASCGEGFVDVIAQLDINRYERRERIATAPGARTAYFSPDRSEFYLAVPDSGAQKAEIRVYQVK